ncbi:MAG TPA: hypothetical protein VI566_10065, partial [Xanthomonadales bacterium]|nr:hypothetical protein [Xanthomonadales bacterium]
MNNNKNLTSTPAPWWKLARGVFASLLAWGLAPSLPAQEAPAPDLQVREYFHQQDADTALMIRLEAFEAGFESRVFDPDGVLLRASALPSLRLGPVFQFIEPVDRPRQIRIEVSLAH